MKELKKIVARATGLPESTITISLRSPLDYQSNRLYNARARDRHLIAKEYLKPDEFQHAPFREFKALERLSPLDIAPQPVSLQPQPGPSLGPIVIYEFMPGHMWNRYRPTAGELKQLAELWLRIHQIEADDLWLSRSYERDLMEIESDFRHTFQHYMAWTEVNFAPGQRAADLCLSLLDRCHEVVHELSSYEPPLCFCRADARFANIIRRPDGQLGMVDWEDSGLCDPARDLADLQSHPNQEDLISPDKWQAFLQPYFAVRHKLDPHLQRRMHCCLTISSIFWLSILIQRGTKAVSTKKLADWTVNGMSAEVRLRRYLARALAWPDLDFSYQLEKLANINFFLDL